ncbi:uncharacterized protein LOC144442526 isoform X2 [Glandiceps talaboti]
MTSTLAVVFTVIIFSAVLHVNAEYERSVDDPLTRLQKSLCNSSPYTGIVAKSPGKIGSVGHTYKSTGLMFGKRSGKAPSWLHKIMMETIC